MKKRQLSRRERDMMEEAITRVCKAMGIPEKDPELRQVAWAALLDVYRDDPAGFTGGRMRGWRRAYRLAWDALEAEKRTGGGAYTSSPWTSPWGTTPRTPCCNCSTRPAAALKTACACTSICSASTPTCAVWPWG